MYHIRLHDQQGGSIPHQSLASEKEDITSSRFPKIAGVTTTGTIYHMAASHGGSDSPRFTEVSSFRKETLTMQANGLHTVFSPCFPPAGNREKQVRK